MKGERRDKWRKTGEEGEEIKGERKGAKRKRYERERRVAGIISISFSAYTI